MGNFLSVGIVQTALEIGLIFLVVVLLLYWRVIRRYCRAKQYYAVYAVLAVLALGVTEPRLMNLLYNVFPLLIFAKIGAEEPCPADAFPILKKQPVDQM